MFSRYNRAPILGMGKQFGTSNYINVIRTAVKNGTLPTKELVINESQRTDHLAGIIYGDGRLWWILAAASNIGYSLQVPPGTIILAPSLEDVVALIG